MTDESVNDMMVGELVSLLAEEGQKLVDEDGYFVEDREDAAARYIIVPDEEDDEPLPMKVDLLDEHPDRGEVELGDFWEVDNDIYLLDDGCVVEFREDQTTYVHNEEDVFDM